MIVHVERGDQQRVQGAQPRPHLGVGRGRVRRARLHVQPLALTLAFHVGRRLLGRRDGQVGVAPDPLTLLRRGGMRLVLRGRLRGGYALHVPNDPHAESSLTEWSKRHHIHRFAIEFLSSPNVNGLRIRG